MRLPQQMYDERLVTPMREDLTRLGVKEMRTPEEVDETLANPMGTLHGGVYCDLSDAAMGYAYAATLAEGESFTTVELKINFFRPVRTGKLTAEARVVKAGSSLGYVECDVTDQASKLVARAASTCMKLRETRLSAT